MHSNMCICPSFGGSLSITKVKGIDGNIPLFERSTIYQTNTTQEEGFKIVVSKVVQDEGLKPTGPGIGKIYSYINSLELKNPFNGEVLKLDMPKSKDIHLTRPGEGSYVGIIGEHPQIGDADVRLFA